MSVQALTIQSLPQLRLFMEHHVFAVWDFMLLLKSLQQHLAPSGIPWCPPPYPRIAGLINGLVAEEECDLLPEAFGGPLSLSHFSLYRLAMQQVGAATGPIDAVLALASSQGLDAALAHPDIPEPARRFMAFDVDLIRTDDPCLLAASFCYGRELLVPDLFSGLRDQLLRHHLDAPLLIWYLERHIALDGGSHGPLAESMVSELCAGRPAALKAVAALRPMVVRERQLFWSSIAEAIGRSAGDQLLMVAGLNSNRHPAPHPAVPMP